MIRRNRTHERLVALFLLGVLLLLPPFLQVFNRPVRVLGIPVLYLYIFVAWGVLIALAAAVVRRIAIDDADPGGSAGNGTAAVDGTNPVEEVRDA